MADTLPPAMTEAEARSEIELFTEAASAPALSATDVDTLVRKAKRADYLGLPPSDPNWRPTWNLASAIALGWQLKASRLVGRTQFSSNGQTFNRQQFYEHCQEQAKTWKKKASETITISGGYRRSGYRRKSGVELAQSNNVDDEGLI